MNPWRRIQDPSRTPPSNFPRRNERYLLDTRLTMTISDSPHSIARHSRTLDISEGGVAGVFHDDFDVNIRVNLEIALRTSHDPLKVGAIVRHHTGLRYGFEFIDVTADQRTILKDACKYLAINKSV